MQEIIHQLIESLEYIGIFGLMSVFASELVMPFAGFLAWKSDLSLLGAIIAGTLGSSFGSILIYYLSGVIDHSKIRKFVSRYGKLLSISVKNLDRAERWFDRHAKLSVFAGRLIPGLRTAVSISAGYRRMALLPFVLCTIIATAISTTILAFAGYFISSEYDTVQSIATSLSSVIPAILIGLVILYVIYRRQKSSK